MEQYSIDRIKILKMDIEGAEMNVFQNSPEDWIELVDNVLIETHGDEIENYIIGFFEQQCIRVSSLPQSMVL